MTCLVTCPTCGGKGTAKLSNVLQRTLDHVSVRGWKSTSAIFGELAGDGVIQTAIANRLNALRTMGLVKVSKSGRAKLWRRVK